MGGRWILLGLEECQRHNLQGRQVFTRRRSTHFALQTRPRGGEDHHCSDLSAAVEGQGWESHRYLRRKLEEREGHGETRRGTRLDVCKVR